MKAPDSVRVWRMRRLTRDGTVEPVSRDQIFRREQGEENKTKNWLADHEQGWQPYLVDPYFVIYVITQLSTITNITPLDIAFALSMILAPSFLRLHADEQSFHSL